MISEKFFLRRVRPPCRLIERREARWTVSVRQSRAPYEAIRQAPGRFAGFCRQETRQECQGGLHRQQNRAQCPQRVD